MNNKGFDDMETKQAQSIQSQENCLNYYDRVRHDSELLCETLEVEDFGIQTMPEVSPPKWHLAHTSWFFETLLLKAFNKNYKEYNSKFAILFNSYYDTIGSYHPRDKRGLLSRPTVIEVYAYRKYVDEAMKSLITHKNHPQQQEIISRTILGLNHEQQHQELLLTDIKHIFARNPLRPIYKKSGTTQNMKLVSEKTSEVNWVKFNGGIKSIGFVGDGFSYDNEGPQHKTYVENFELASRPVTNGEYLEFINAGGYQQVSLWLSDAWKIVNQEQWLAPLYWEQKTKIKNGNNITDWHYMTLAGIQEIDANAPVCHVSYFEAAAYTRWLSEQQPGIRLPTEAEWEIAAGDLPVKGNF